MLGDRSHLFIVGAGFSKHAGLPLTAEFTSELLRKRHLKHEGPSYLIIEILNRFVRDVFGQDANAPPETWPQLEDIFTSVDLAANSGHHLGSEYSPADLRTVRRALLTRIIRMLYQVRGRADSSHAKNPSSELTALEEFFTRVRVGGSAFLSMNWDTVIEEGLETANHVDGFEYGCDALQMNLGSSGAHLVASKGDRKPMILKPHGSANWLYCDSCRQLFWTDTDQTEAVAKQLFRRRDWQIVEKFVGRGANSKVSSARCPTCKADALGTRFATFSYRKALDFPMHVRTWLLAERLLQNAATWTFIGYSLPAADYEFKHLLKQAQLSRRKPLGITVITGGGDADSTIGNYRRFLGNDLHVFKAGLSTDAFNHLAGLGALSR